MTGVTLLSAAEELGAFLRRSRARLRPADVGIPPGTRRRTTGLRREEVARLANVGLTWYTWLEQGRAHNPSVQVLDSLARALRLTQAEHNYLYTLTGRPPVGDASAPSGIAMDHLTLLEQSLPYPMCIQTETLNLLAYNRTFRFMISDIDAVPADRLNTGLLALTDPDWTSRYVNHESIVMIIARKLRSRRAEHRNDPAWDDLITTYISESPLFREIWDRGDVGDPLIDGTKSFDNAHVGLINFRMNYLHISDMPGTHIIFWMPDDEQTLHRVHELNSRYACEPAVSNRTDTAWQAHRSGILVESATHEGTLSP